MADRGNGEQPAPTELEQELQGSARHVAEDDQRYPDHGHPDRQAEKAGLRDGKDGPTGPGTEGPDAEEPTTEDPEAD